MKVTMEISEELAAQVRLRGSYYGVPARDLERFYDLLDRERACIEKLFSEREVNLLRQAWSSTRWEPWSIRHMAASVEDALRGTSADGVDAEDLTARLRGLNAVQKLALVDAVESWWQRQGSGGDDQDDD